MSRALRIKLQMIFLQRIHLEQIKNKILNGVKKPVCLSSAESFHLIRGYQ
jgi:hypothetical protein